MLLSHKGECFILNVTLSQNSFVYQSLSNGGVFINSKCFHQLIQRFRYFCESGLIYYQQQ